MGGPLTAAVVRANHPGRRGPTARSVPEVIQTATLDCGPAALTALLRGLGVTASYEALRHHCATDVDGTNIDTMESVAAAIGVDAEQLVVPAEHVLALPDEYLPAIAVTLLPDGFTHFIVIWRRRGGRFEVMDPAYGRRWLRGRDLKAELYRHRTAVPAAAWREWAGSDVFTVALRARLETVGVSPDEAALRVEEALRDEGHHALADLDARIRHRETTGEPLNGSAPPDDAYSCASLDDDQVELRGAVIVRARQVDTDAADPHLLAELTAPEPTALAVLEQTTHRPWLTAYAIALIGLVVGAGFLAEVIVLRPFLDAGSGDTALAIAVIATSAVLWIAGLVLIRSFGRAIEFELRRRLASAVGRLPDVWVRTRPASDLADRAHMLHRVRELPSQAFEFAVAIATVLGAAVTVIVLSPATAAGVGALAAAAVLGPALAVRSAAEADLRFRTLGGCLAASLQDALLGAEAVGASNGGAAIELEHERVLGGWRAAGRALVLRTSAVRVIADSVTVSIGCIVVVVAAGREQAGSVVLIGLLVLQIADAGTRLADLLRSAPVVRSVVARVASWLHAASVAVDETSVRRGRRTEVRLESVGVQVGSISVLAEVTLTIPAGAHVAVVGASGSGKSTLLSLLTRTVTPTSGSVQSSATRETTAWIAPETRLWNFGLAPNLTYGDDSSASPVGGRIVLAELEDVATRLDRRGNPDLGEGGRVLSDGQAQRVRIARAAGRQGAALVVLDEPFQGLERDRRERLMRSVRGHWAGSTLVCATHDVEDTEEFDLVVVMDGGRVVEAGPPAHLPATGPYRRMLEAARRVRFGDGWRTVHLPDPT